MLELFFQELDKLFPVGDKALLAEIEKKIFVQAKPKGSILLNEGEYSTRVIFLLTGLARGFYYQDGNEITSWILPENNFLFSPSNFLTDQPANESIQLLEDSDVLIMSKATLQSLQLVYPEAALLTVRVLEKYLNNYDNRVRFLRLSAKARLESYESEYPTIVNRLTIPQLASFLGLSKSSISHIRNKK